MVASLFDDKPPRAKAKTASLFALLMVMNVTAWGWALLEFSDRPALLGSALLAYLLGLRHAFDADHIAAIDNVVRKLMQGGLRPISSGFFFSLGHSTIVVLASLAVAATAVVFQDRHQGLVGLGGTIGTLISASFLLGIGIANLFVLRGIWSAFRRTRGGERFVDHELDSLLEGRGLLARLLRPVFRIVTRSWHMYPVGFLFGLGFDTATEIGLLGLSASQASQGLSFWSVLVFPALFTAGMSLMDTLDSALMTGAYGWAFVDPLRKLWYNLTLTAASAVAALCIGSLEALGLVAEKLDLQGGVWSLVGSLGDDVASSGFAIVGLFAASWFVSALVYRSIEDGRLGRTGLE